MIKAPRTRIGDVFSVALSPQGKKYFQFVANDPTQLNSDVIRAFATVYLAGSHAPLEAIVAGEIQFHAHVVIKWGLKMELWSRVGNTPIIGQLDVLFRGSHNSTKSAINNSNDWYVWRIGGPMRDVGTLEGDNRRAEFGLVMSPENIVNRMRTGRYLFRDLAQLEP